MKLYVVLLQTVAFQLQITLPVQRGVKPCHYPGLFDNLRMNKKVQTIVDIIGTDGKKKKVKAACSGLLQPLAGSRCSNSGLNRVTGQPRQAKEGFSFKTQCLKTQP